MARVGRQVGLLLRIVMGVLLLSNPFDVSRLHAQPPAQAPPPDPGATQPITPLPAANAAPISAEPRVIDILVVGNRTITREKVLGGIGTRVGQPYDQTIFERDIRKLAGKNWFVDVRPKKEAVPGGIVITLEVIERPTLQYVRYLGLKKITTKALAKETGLKKGDPLDPYAIEEGRRKIESFCQTKGYNDVKVTILEGTKPGDTGATYLISEGQTQKVWKVRFEGNSPDIATDSRLKTQIQSKPPLAYLFKGQFDRKKVDEDVEKLTTYYRGLGFFKAHVGRDFEFNEKENWVTLVFYIDEGPRYRVRELSFVGNSKYDDTVLRSNLKLKPGDYYDLAKMNADIGTFKDMYGSNGYVFAEAEADIRFFIEPGEVDLVYHVKEGKQCRAGEIKIHIGGDSPHTRYAAALNRMTIRPGDIIDIRQVRASETRLKRSALFNTDPSKGDAPRIVLSPPDSEDGTSRSKKGVAKRTGNPDSFRGQSPDANPASPNAVPPASQTPSANRYQNQAPAAPAPLSPNGDGSSAPRIRMQSPDSGYGGRAVNPISPGPGPGPYTAQAPGGYTTQPPIVGAPPAGSIYGQNPTQPPPNYGPPGGEQVPPGTQPYGDGGLLSGPPPVDDVPPVIPLDVYLNETQTGRFMFGAGVNSNAGIVGSIVIDERNFDWRRIPSSWEDFRSGRAFRGGGQQFRIEAAPGTQVSRYMFSFTEPYLFDTPVSLGLSGYYFNRFYRDWAEQRVGARTSLGYQFSPDLSGNVSLRAEDIRIYNPRVPGVPALDAVLGHTQIYSIMSQLAHDTRDSTFLATEGHYIRADFEYAVGSFQFPRFNLDLRRHFLLKERPDTSGRHVLSVYTQLGFAGKDTPIYERYYAGGFASLRGFQFRGASPMYVINGDTVEVGGDFQTLSSVEYLFPITADDMLRGVTFVDFGTVEPNVHIDWRDFRVAPGLGLRVSIPAMGPAPIALDFAFPVQHAPNDLRQVFSFFVGFGR